MCLIKNSQIKIRCVIVAMAKAVVGITLCMIYEIISGFVLTVLSPSMLTKMLLKILLKTLQSE